MFGHRTPIKPRPTEEAPKDPHGKGKSPSPKAHSSNTSSVRRSIGEWEDGKQDTLPKPLAKLKKTKTEIPPKPKQKLSISQAEPIVDTRRMPTEATENVLSVQKRSLKFTDRLAEAKACLDAAIEYISNSRNTKTEIKTEVTYALNRLYQLVKEGEKGKRPTNDGEQTPLETDKEPKMRKEEGELSKQLEEHTRLLQENNDRMKQVMESLERQQEMQQIVCQCGSGAPSEARTDGTSFHRSYYIRRK